MSAATSAAAMPHIVIMFSVRKSVVSPPLYYIQHGGDSTAYECAANGCYYGGNYTAEPFLRAVFYLGKLLLLRVKALADALLKLHNNLRAAEIGTRMHEWAKNTIDLRNKTATF